MLNDKNNKQILPDPSSEKTIQGTIARFTFQNLENGYSVVLLNDGTTAVGVLPGMKVGESVELTGRWETHSKYGWQFKFNSFTPLYPTKLDAIEKYLGSGLIKGLGPVTAKRIVKYFKEDTFEILDRHIERLQEIEGIGQVRMEMIKKGWADHSAIKHIMIFLQSHQISPAYAVKIYKTYGKEAVRIVKENPYRLSYDIWGIGFKTADNIGKSLGFTGNHPLRIKAGVRYVLNQATEDGHVFLPKDVLIENCKSILDYDLNETPVLLTEMDMNKELVIKNDNVYAPEFYYAEREIEKGISILLGTPNIISKSQIEKLRLSRSFYSEEQLIAIRNSLQSKILILTGGPGTGKTTTLKGIIDVNRQLKHTILLAAPTGRAAKRMSEVIKMEAKTIHRLLEYNPKDNTFRKNQHDKLKCDLLVLDETSMIDTILMYRVITAMPNEATMVLVGDVDQLPSVGAGNVLKDLINSNKIATVKLTKIFRQAEKSHIIVNAHRVNNGDLPVLINDKTSDFFFIEENDVSKIPDLVVNLCLNRLPKTYGFNAIKDIQVLTPMYKGDSGANNLNEYLQSILNPRHFAFTGTEKKYKIGDKVLQLKNNYDKDVFNGDWGNVIDVDDESQTISIDFAGKYTTYEFADMDELTLAYAITVHKSQGSEYPCVILPLTLSHFMLLQRNLLYTAITRAKKLMIIVGSKRAMAIAVKNNKIEERYTSLMKAVV